MPTSPPVPVNPSVLSWARNEGGYDVDRVAKRLQVKAERVEAWESGERTPTMRQVQQLARFLHRPLNLFFLPAPPKLAPLAAEYRRLPGIEPGEETPELRLAIRQMSSRRETTLELMEELGGVIPDFALEAHLTEEPSSVGMRLREAVRITEEQQIGWRDEYQAWREWRAAAERIGVLVFQFPKVDLNEARGLSLLRFPLPVVGINSKELPESRIYTLLHELIHVMLARGKEEAPALNEKRSGKEWETVERFAETAASHAVITEESLRNTVTQRSGKWDIASVRRLARRFRVTPLAMATRLRAAGFMSWDVYNMWKADWSEHLKTLPQRSGGFAHPVDTTLGRHGRPFVQLVLEALDSNRITSVDASRHLGLKFEHFGRLRDGFVRGPGGTTVE